MAPSPKRIKASGNSSTGIASSKPGSKSPKPRRNPTRSNVSNVVNLETNHTPSGEYDELSEKLIAENKNTQLITAPAPKRIKTTGNSPTGMASSKPGSKSPKPRRNPTRSNVSNVGNLETSDTPSGEYEELSEKLIAENKNTHLITAPSPKRIKTTGNSPTGMASSKPGSKSPKPRHNPTRSNVSNVGNLETIHTPSGEYEELSEKLIAENKNTHLITAPAPKRVSKAGNSSIGVASGSSKPGAKSSEPSRKPTGRSNVSNLELLQTCYTPPGKYDERAEQFAERLIAENLLENPSLAVEQSTPSRLLPEQDELIDFFSNLFGSSKKSSTKKSTNKKIKANKIPKTPKTHVDLDQWLEYDARPQTPPDPNKSALDKIFEKYMEDPYAPMARFLPKVEKKSPEKPLTFFSPVKERVPFSTPPVFSKSRRALGLGSPINLGPPAPSGAKKEMQLDVDVTPLHGKYLDARAYSPVSSVGKPYKLFGSSGGPLSYGSDPYFEIQNAALCSTPLASKTPSETVNRSLTFSGVPAPVATTPDLDSSTLAKRGGSYGTNTPGGIISSILFGIICFVDVRYDKEDHSEWVRRDVIGHGARAEKTFNKKVNLVIFKAGKISTYMKAKENNIPIVSLLWIHACKQVGGLVDPKLYAPSDDEQYQKNVPIEEARKRARFYARGQRFLDRLDGKLPPKPPRAPRSNKKKVVPTTEGKKRKRIDGKTIRKDPVKGTQPRKGPIKLDFNHPSTSQCADQKSAGDDLQIPE